MNDTLLNKIIHEKQNLKYLHVLSSLYIFGILTSITVSARLFSFHIPLTDISILLTGGTWTVPFTFFIQDIATEVYGYSKSKQIILLSIPIVILYIGYLKITTFFSIPTTPNVSSSYNEIFNSLPQHLLALLAAIITGNFINNYVLKKLKIIFKGRFLAMRFIGSTAIGEAAAQLIGTTIAWIGNLHFKSEIIPFILFSYFYKISFESILTPLNITICKWLKSNEGIDIYDN